MKNSTETPLKLENISEGMLVKNYQVLCKLLEQPILYGNSKRAQEKVFNQYFEASKEGYSIRVGKIHLQPLPKLRKVSKMSRATALQCYNLMFDLCQEITEEDATEETIITTTRNQKQLHLLLGICNPEYYENKAFIVQNTPARKKNYQESIFANLPIQHVTDFYKEVDERGRGHINRLIDNFIEGVHKQYLVIARKTYNIKIGSTYRLCTTEQFSEIFNAIGRTLRLEKYIITVNGLSEIPTERDIYLLGRMKEFYADLLNDEYIAATGITQIYSIWEFSFTRELINTLDRYAEIYGICQEGALQELNIKAVKYHDMRTLKRETKILTEGKDCFLPENFLEDWLDTHYRPSRELLRTLIQVQPTKPQ